MILVLDNYDSFTYNLVQYLGELGLEIDVRRNDAIAVDDVEALKPDAIVISPGPCTPADSGISVPLVRRWGSSIPILGVCLGHQASVDASGGRVVRAGRDMHGKTTRGLHDGTDLFRALPSPLEVMRYHSLIADPGSLPSTLAVTAVAQDDATEIHAIRHREHPVWGVQFHPESVMTPQGKDLLRNFIALASTARSQAA
jgi:anthranilate synthase/aminodeoxychorismate synthase-like glutamine amidotransferase